MRRREVLYAVIGGVVGAVLTMAAGLFSPLGVQSQAERNLGKIVCTEVEVVRPDGTPGAWIYANDEGGRVIVYGRSGTLKNSVNLMYGDGGFVGVFGSNGTTQAGMGVWEGEKGESGGRIHVWGSDKLRGLDFSFPQATIGGSEDGGSFNIKSADGGSIYMSAAPDAPHFHLYGKRGGGELYRAVDISLAKNGGLISTSNKNLEVGASMLASKDGGGVAVYGKRG